MGMFDRLSPDFAKSLEKELNPLLKKKAQCGCQDNSSPASQELKAKQDRISDVLGLIRDFNDRIIKEWMYSLDEQSIEEVARLFGELNQVGAIQFGMLMKASGACCPWKIIGDMFAPAEENALIIIEDKQEGADQIPPPLG